jgi:hypothetical protein
MSSEASLLLVQHLCLEAGRLMENTCVQLAYALPADPDERMAHLERTQETAADISSLMDAAAALIRCANEIR